MRSALAALFFAASALADCPRRSPPPDLRTVVLAGESLTLSLDVAPGSDGCFRRPRVDVEFTDALHVLPLERRSRTTRGNVTRYRAREPGTLVRARFDGSTLTDLRVRLAASRVRKLGAPGLRELDIRGTSAVTETRIE